MTAGTRTMGGLHVPLLGEFTITQQDGTIDIATIKGANGQTGDFLNLIDSTSTERFSVEDGGNVVITQKSAGDIGIVIKRASTPTASALEVQDNGGTLLAGISKKGHFLLRRYTTKPTTGLTKNELFLLYHGSTPKLAVVTSTAANTIKMVRAKTKTVGRLTA